MLRKLENKKIAILATDGFEKVELTVPLKALRLAGASVDIISLHKGSIRAMNLHKPASTIKVDKVISEVNVNQYDGLLIPGGFINPDLLRQSQEVRDFVKNFDDLNKPIASLCHGPWVLASAGILNGRKLTSWPGLRDDMVNAGATWIEKNVVADRNLVTSRGPQDLPFFVTSILDLFESGSVKEETFAETSDPQASEPPMLVQQTVSWVSGFPYKWAALAGVAGLGVYGVLTNKGTNFDFLRER